MLLSVFRKIVTHYERQYKQWVTGVAVTVVVYLAKRLYTMPKCPTCNKEVYFGTYLVNRTINFLIHLINYKFLVFTVKTPNKEIVMHYWTSVIA